MQLIPTNFYVFKYFFYVHEFKPHKILTYQMVKNQNYVVLVKERVRQAYP